MPKVTVIKADAWGVMVRQGRKPKWINLPTQSIRVEMDMDKNLFELVRKDPLLQATLWEAASNSYNTFISDCSKSYADADKDLDTIAKKNPGNLNNLGPTDLRNVQNVWFTLRTKLEQHEKDVKSGVPKDVMDAWGKLKKKDKEYRNYKIKAAVSLTLRASAVGFAIAATAGTGGATLLGIQTMTSGILSCIQDCRKLWIEADTLKADTDELIKTLNNRFDAGIKKANLTDFASANFKTVFGIDVSNISKAENNIKTYRKKLIGIDQRSRKEIPALVKAIKNIEDNTASLPANTDLKRIDLQMAELQEIFEKSFETISRLQTEANITGPKWADKQMKAVEILSAKKPGSIKFLEKGLATALAGTKVGNDYMDMEKFLASAEKQAGNAVRIANGAYHAYQRYEKERLALAKMF